MFRYPSVVTDAFGGRAFTVDGPCALQLTCFSGTSFVFLWFVMDCCNSACQECGRRCDFVFPRRSVRNFFRYMHGIPIGIIPVFDIKAYGKNGVELICLLWANVFLSEAHTKQFDFAATQMKGYLCCGRRDRAPFVCSTVLPVPHAFYPCFEIAPTLILIGWVELNLKYY